MKVALFTEAYFPFISGVVTHIQTVKQGLEAAGHEALIVTLDPKAEKHYIKDGVLYCPSMPLKKIYGYGVSNPLNLRRLQIIRDFDPDIIHTHTEFTMGLFALFAARQLKKPLVYTLHTMYDDYLFYLFPDKAPKPIKKLAKPLAHRYIRDVACKATEIIGPSRKVAEYLRLCGVSRHVNIVPNIVDVTAFLPENRDEDKTREAKTRLGIEDGDIALAFVGRLGREKSIDVLIDYFTKGFKGQSGFKLFIAGDGPEKQTLQAQVQSLGMNGQIKLLGKMSHENVPHFYNACDLFATASLSEMNSISMLEATASGLYTLQRLDVYNRDQIESGVNGDVFTSPEEFAGIVQQYAALPPQQKAAWKQKVTAYSRRYGRDEFMARMMQVYTLALHQHSNK